jgi:putative membrane protein
METTPAFQDKQANRVINILAATIPLAVGILLSLPFRVDLGGWTKLLPHLNAVLNTVTASLLLLGLYFIRQRNIDAHRRTMLTAFTLGSIFLVSYVLYHFTNVSAKFGGQGWIRPVYLFLLISHISLSVVVVWFVLRAVYFALSKQFDRHRKTVRWAYPIWLYVSVTGVIVYFLISPYYN